MRRRLGTAAAAAVVAVGKDLVVAIGTDPVSLAVAAVVGVVVLILTNLVDDGTIITTADGIGISHILHATSTSSSSNSSGRGGENFGAVGEVAVGPDEHGVGRFRRAAAAAGRTAGVRHIAARFAQPVALLGQVALAESAVGSSPALASASSAPASPPTASEGTAAAAPSVLTISPAGIARRRCRSPRPRGDACRIRRCLDGRVGKWHASCKFPTRVGWIGLAAVRIEVAAILAGRRCRSGPRRDECCPHLDVIV